MATSLFDRIGRERTQQLMDEAVRNAVAEAHAKGVAVTGMVDGVLSRILPDGTIEPIEPAEGADKKASA